MIDAVSDDLSRIRAAKSALNSALAKGRSRKWLFRLWSSFIRARDAFRCVCCEATGPLQAHHIIRKTLNPYCSFDLGNGITLCSVCHGRVHAEFNGRPDLTLPLGAEQGDDQDEWAFLFGLLRDDAIRRNLPEDELYFVNDATLKFSLDFQGYQSLYNLVMKGEISRVRYMHEVWRSMPEDFYDNCVSELIRLNLSVT